MIQRIRNLWAWSAIAPQSVVLGDAKSGYEWAQPTQIIYPNRKEDILKAKPDASLDELIS